VTVVKLWCIGAVVLVVFAVYAVRVGAPWWCSYLSVIGVSIPLVRAFWDMRKGR
jgi:hypothetical protein